MTQESSDIRINVTEQGKVLADLLAQTRVFYRQAGLMIGAADQLMQRNGWDRVRPGYASVPKDARISHNWMPEDLFHFYKREDGRGGLLRPFYCVIVHNIDEPHLVGEPLASTGWIEFETSNAMEGCGDEAAHAHIWADSRRDDGQFIISLSKPSWPAWAQGVRAATTMALPLVTINTDDDMETKLIKPMLIGLENAMRKAGA